MVGEGVGAAWGEAGNPHLPTETNSMTLEEVTHIPDIRKS